MVNDMQWTSEVASVLGKHVLLVLGAVLFLLASTGGVEYDTFRVPVSDNEWRIALAVVGVTCLVTDVYLVEKQYIVVSGYFGTTRKLKKFLNGFDHSDSISVYLPLYPDTLVEPPVKEATSYRITATSLSDILAAERVLQVMSPLGFRLTSKKVRISHGADLLEFSQRSSKLAFVFGGSAANKITNSLTHRTDIETSVDTAKFTLKYRLQDKVVAIVPSAEDRSEETVREQSSYGVIFRTNEQLDNKSVRSTFVLFGLDERATRRTADWFTNNWLSEIYDRFGSGEFLAILRITPDKGVESVERDGTSSALIPKSWIS